MNIPTKLIKGFNLKVLSKLLVITSIVFVSLVAKTSAAELTQTTMDKLVEASGFE